MTQEATAQLPIINMLWIGGQLGLTERLSIASYMRHGHPVHLHTYGDIQNAPDGVVHVDAAKLMSHELALSLRSKPAGSFALAADYYRMKLLEQGAGIWSDADVICVRPLSTTGVDALFGLEDGRQVEGVERLGNAILYLKPGSPIITRTLASFVPNRIPDWLPLARRPRLWGRRLTLQSFGPPDYRWGTFGPIALSILAHKHGIAHLAAPIDTYYPLARANWRSVYEPGSSFDSVITERTRTIHLWHSIHRDQSASSTSAMGRLAAELGIA